MDINKSKYTGLGITGLANLGNTCYLNSCMQILSHTYELSEYLSSTKYEKNLNNIPESLLLVEWDKLRQLMWSKNCTIAPHGYVKAVQKVASQKKLELFTGYAQNDIQEFLMFILDAFHKAVSRGVNMNITGIIKNDKDSLAKECYSMMKRIYEEDYSEIVDIFCGVCVSEIRDTENEEMLSITPEPFFVLSLPIPSNKKNITVIDCITEYCKVEGLIGDNGRINEKTKLKQDVNKRILFWSLPPVLIIHIKRWGYDGRKNKQHVTTNNDYLDMRNFINGYNKESYIYELYGVCNHSGSSNGGHYTSNVCVADGSWRNFNDTSITKINSSKAVTQQAYCLFYRKKK